MPHVRRAPWRTSLVIFLLPLVVSERADGWESRWEPSSEPRKPPAPQSQPESDDDDDDDDDNKGQVKETILIRLGPELGWMQYGGSYELSYETDSFSGNTAGKLSQKSAFFRALRFELGGVISLYADAMAVAPKGTFSYGWLGQTTGSAELLGQSFSWESQAKLLSLGTGLEFQFFERKLVLTPEAGITSVWQSIQSTSPEDVHISANEGGVYGRVNAGYRKTLSPSFALVAVSHASYLVIMEAGLEDRRTSLGATLFLEWDPFRIEEAPQ